MVCPSPNQLISIQIVLIIDVAVDNVVIFIVCHCSPGCSLCFSPRHHIFFPMLYYLFKVCSNIFYFGKYFLQISTSNDKLLKNNFRGIACRWSRGRLAQWKTIRFVIFLSKLERVQFTRRDFFRRDK